MSSTIRGVAAVSAGLALVTFAPAAAAPGTTDQVATQTKLGVGAFRTAAAPRWRAVNAAYTRRHAARPRHAVPQTLQQTAQVMLAARGWANQWDCLDALWSKESDWQVHAENSSGAYGIPQALPGDRMAAAGSDWRDNAVTQIRWGIDYIAARYGTPCNAWEHSQYSNWY